MIEDNNFWQDTPSSIPLSAENIIPKKLPITPPATTKEYKNLYNPRLEESGLRIVNSRWDNFLNIFFIFICLLVLSGIGYFLFLIHQGAFKPDFNITQPINIQSNTTFSPTNNYNFVPETKNTYQNNFTIINEIIIKNSS